MQNFSTFMANLTSALPSELLSLAVWIQPCPKLPCSKVQPDPCGQDLSLVAVPRAPGTPLDREPQVSCALSGETQALSSASTPFGFLEFWMGFVCAIY